MKLILLQYFLFNLLLLNILIQLSKPKKLITRYLLLFTFKFKQMKISEAHQILKCILNLLSNLNYLLILFDIFILKILLKACSK